jgi:hypothetical protein
MKHMKPNRVSQQLATAAALGFADPEAERQFQQSYAATRRFWDATGTLVIMSLLPLLVNLPALKARLCPVPTVNDLTSSSLEPAWQLHPLLRTFPCAEAGPATSSTQLAQVVWLVRHWAPATAALYRINGDLEGSMANLCCIVALACLVWTRGTAVTAEGYSRNRTLLMSIWRIGKSMSGLLALVAHKLQRLPGWPAYTVEMYWGRTTMFGATRLLWHAHLMAVRPPAAAVFHALWLA